MVFSEGEILPLVQYVLLNWLQMRLQKRVRGGLSTVLEAVVVRIMASQRCLHPNPEPVNELYGKGELRLLISWP